MQIFPLKQSMTLWGDGMGFPRWHPDQVMLPATSMNVLSFLALKSENNLLFEIQSTACSHTPSQRPYRRVGSHSWDSCGAGKLNCACLTAAPATHTPEMFARCPTFAAQFFNRCARAGPPLLSALCTHVSKYNRITQEHHWYLKGFLCVHNAGSKLSALSLFAAMHSGM